MSPLLYFFRKYSQFGAPVDRTSTRMIAMGSVTRAGIVRPDTSTHWRAAAIDCHAGTFEHDIIPWTSCQMCPPGLTTRAAGGAACAFWNPLGRTNILTRRQPRPTSHAGAVLNLSSWWSAVVRAAPYAGRASHLLSPDCTGCRSRRGGLRSGRSCCCAAPVASS